MIRSTRCAAVSAIRRPPHDGHMPHDLQESCYETGRMRRVHLRGRENILKRLLVHIAGFNLSLVLRLTTGKGTPRGLQDLAVAYFFALIALVKHLGQLVNDQNDLVKLEKLKSQHSALDDAHFEIETTTTGC